LQLKLLKYQKLADEIVDPDILSLVSNSSSSENSSGDIESREDISVYENDCNLDLVPRSSG